MEVIGTKVKKYTLNDIEVGSCVYAALVAHARQTLGGAIFYSDLLALARSMHPTDAVLGRAVPIGIGMKLLFVETFCRSNDYPNLACLAVNRNLGRPGAGYTGNWEEDKRRVAAFDWSSAAPQLPIYVREAKEAIPPRKGRRLSEPDARDALFKHFRANRSAYAAVSLIDKEEIVNLLMEHVPADVALAQVLAAKAQFGEED